MSPLNLASPQDLQTWASSLPAADAQAQPELAAALQARLDEKTKPLGALGQLERLALQIGLIQGTSSPQLHAPQVMVFAADHGIARQGVSAYPVEVTPQMVRNFLAHGAAVSVLARANGVAQRVVDCGVAADFEPHPELTIAKVAGVAHGSADSTQGPALTLAQALQAIAKGRAVVQASPGNAVLLGEMGIGNTSPAALLMHALTGTPLADCVGAGTGLDAAGLARKQATLARAVAANAAAAASGDALAVLAALGGLEVASLVGAVLQAAHERRVVVVDGFITTAAVAVAAALAPQVLGYCVFAHCSAESGHARWLQRLGARPLLQLDLRLGEGSGATLAWPLLRAAVVMLADMASFASAGVSTQSAAAGAPA
ncbi:nicotinate-nucleotide--dimethylbenzimidazole phosphoribosyltransferase [Comamonas serinivorans]|uniref:Nicotinate-nucleotide--dimethylbenzimidazole phosphoribosyltransferase n=1 Tax=Comamonas serinivorans TaxID=1082851 RepID=A0A1Y0ER13_9BURK|nr:nicotinate-nucleotide--dimethylbenzimidazole phosphoribosyltransferase [Comamonas serinivorans]ARU05692.1 nicotinate-nucleotide--dimethylbenzimidazole phosphoribosyltransferase [Comamonas serinivorans]